MASSSNRPTAKHPTRVDDEIVVYWRRGCPFCIALRAGLHRAGLPFREVDIWADPSAAAFVRSVANGNETVPTVRVGNRTLVNPSAKLVVSTARVELPGIAPAASPSSAERGGRLGWLRRRHPRA